jgi:ADP-heptose:LPS heptosyltransferase
MSAEKVELDGRRILVVVYGHVADTMAAIPGLRSLRAAFPSASIDVLALDSAASILGPSPYIDNLITWRDFQHKGERVARVEKLGVISSLALRLKRRGYAATLVFHRSSGAMRKLSSMVGSGVRAGVSTGGENFTHPARPGPSVESSREENRRVLEAIGVIEDGGPVELWTSDEDKKWAADFTVSRDGPIVGIHPGSDWSCQQWLPKRFAEVARSLQANAGATVVITGSAAEIALESEIADGLTGNVIRACGRTSFGQFVETIKRLDLLICVNSAAAAVANAVGTPAVVLLGLEDARFTGIGGGRRLSLIQPQTATQGGGWCEFGRWGVLSGCDSPMCRGLGGLGNLASSIVVTEALRMLAGASSGSSSRRPDPVGPAGVRAS